MFLILILLSCTSFLSGAELIGRKVVFTAPITELSRNLPLPYDDPASFKNTKPVSFRRAYQALYNDMATIVHAKADAYLLRFDTLIYGYEKNGTPLNCLWAPQSAVQILSENEAALLQSKTTIILQKPWRSETGILYSVATHLALEPSHASDIFQVRLYDSNNQQSYLIDIPHEYAAVVGQLTSVTPGQRMVDAARSLIEMAKPGVVAFVWGGASFCMPRTSTPSLDDNKWVYNHEGFYTGIDGGSLPFLCAKMTDVYFPWKTTDAALKGAPCLRSDETIIPGDIICFAGCLALIASDTTLIRVSGYDIGSGALEEIPFKQMFRNIITINDLQHALLHQEPLHVVTRTADVTEWKLIRPASN